MASIANILKKFKEVLLSGALKGINTGIENVISDRFDKSTSSDFDIREDRIRRLEKTIEEQRRDYDCVEILYSQAKTKNITFLAAALALLGYLYGGTGGSSLKEKLFIPDEPYGVIVYVISFFIFVSAIIILLINLKPYRWSTAHDPQMDELAPKDYEKYLEYIRKRYDYISNINCISYSKKQTLLDVSFLPLVGGGIMLLILKTFGG